MIGCGCCCHEVTYPWNECVCWCNGSECELWWDE